MNVSAGEFICLCGEAIYGLTLYYTHFSLGKSNQAGKGAMRLTLCEVPTRGTRLDPYTGNSVPYSLRQVRGFFNVPCWLYNTEDAGDGAYDLSSLSEKTRTSNHLQMSLQRQHVLLSYFKTLSVGLVWGSNPRPPAQQSGALPTELTGPRSNVYEQKCKQWGQQRFAFQQKLIPPWIIPALAARGGWGGLAPFFNFIPDSLPFFN